MNVLCVTSARRRCGRTSIGLTASGERDSFSTVHTAAPKLTSDAINITDDGTTVTLPPLACVLVTTDN